jgi:hypothetical protein
MLVISVPIIILLGTAFLMGVLSSLSPRLQILRGGSWLIVSVIVSGIVIFFLVFFDRRKWHIGRKLSELREQKEHGIEKDDYSMIKNLPCIFRVDTKRVKATFILTTLFIFACFGTLQIIMYVRGLPTFPFLIFTLLLPSGIFIYLWIYGKYRIFGFEWQFHDDGLRILKNNREMRFIPWQDIRQIDDGYIVIDARDGKKFPITLSPRVRRDVVTKIYSMMNEKTN